jgi:hypothetical protein
LQNLSDRNDFYRPISAIGRSIAGEGGISFGGFFLPSKKNLSRFRLVLRARTSAAATINPSFTQETFMSGILDLTGLLGGLLHDAGEVVGGAVAGVGSTVGTAVGETGEIVGGVVGNVGAVVGGALGDVVGGATSAVGSVLDGTHAAVGDVVAGVGDAVGLIGDGVGDALGSVLGGLFGHLDFNF